jgi:diaminohydroxyphosphoribosylaminopyrimidine deaminase/5-amino-6-(5-phosphoribosylamino)uracil reductase
MHRAAPADRTAAAATTAPAPTTQATPLDLQRLRQALALAETSFGLTEPNPRVGCVIGRPDGAVLGQGATQQAGGPHAEVMALRDAAAVGADVRGAIAWVTLEPCAHHGRTPPCADALLAAGIGRVVVAAHDPFAEVDGRGIARLRAAGVEVVELPAPPPDGAPAADEATAIAAAAHELNIGFFSRLQRGRPWVRLKVAASLDGRTALPDGRSQWITGEAARTDGHAWRRRASAVLTGVGTVLTDDPRLDVRLVPTAMQPLRLVLDPALRTPVHARLLAPPGRGCWLFAAPGADPARREALRAAGAEVFDGPAMPAAPGQPGRTDLAALLPLLAQRGVNELHVEAGPTLNGALLAAGLVDDLLVYLAPRLLGEGRGMAALGVLPDLEASPWFQLLDAVPVGADLRLRLRRRPQA